MAVSSFAYCRVAGLSEGFDELNIILFSSGDPSETNRLLLLSHFAFARLSPAAAIHKCWQRMCTELRRRRGRMRRSKKGRKDGRKDGRRKEGCNKAGEEEGRRAQGRLLLSPKRAGIKLPCLPPPEFLCASCLPKNRASPL